jgi:ABC-2 type transport system permease protein
MRWDIVRTVVGREAIEILRNRLLLISIALPPVILTIVPLVILKFELDAAPRMGAAAVAQLIAGHPEWKSFSESEVVAAFTVQQFLNFFLIMPAYIPLAIASYSIVGEKQTRSLEAVLATPIRTGELLAGKALAALVPAVITSWLSYLVLIALASALIGGHMIDVLTDTTWLAAVLALGPAIGLVSVSAGVIVSSRVNDPRVAQQVGGLIIVPIVGLVVLQTTGRFVIGVREYLLGALVVAIIGVVGLRLGTIIFGRETILTRWK